MNTMPLWQQAALITICAFGTILTRFLPFLIFQKAEELPAYIQYLGKALPTAVFALLVVFCLRNVSFTTGNCGLPEIISLLVPRLFMSGDGRCFYPCSSVPPAICS